MAAGTAFPAQRLWLVPVLTWALHFGGWLGLGALGREHLPRFAGGMAPLALWLLVIGLSLALAGRRPWHARILRGVLIVAGLAPLGLSLWIQPPGIALLLIATVWGALVVAASSSVRALRGLQPRRPCAPVAPTMLGAALAWAAFGNLDALRGTLQTGPVLAAAALLLGSLLPAGGVARPCCRVGLFDLRAHAPPGRSG